jgi:hypothetical protein
MLPPGIICADASGGKNASKASKAMTVYLILFPISEKLQKKSDHSAGDRLFREKDHKKEQGDGEKGGKYLSNWHRNGCHHLLAKILMIRGET